MTCRNKEDQITNEAAKIVKTLYIDLSNAQGS